MQAYLSYFKLRCITNLQYRTDAIAGILTQFFFGLVYIMVYLAFYESGGENIPMNFYELVNYIWLQQAFYAIIYPYEQDKELLNMIRDGNLAYELVRPLNLYLKWYIKMISKKCISTLLRFIPVLLIAFMLPSPLNLTMPLTIYHFILFIISLILGCLLTSSLTIIIHIITMFTIESKGITNMYSTISLLFMGAIVPIPFLPKWMQNISIYLPFKYIGDFPFRIYSGSITLSNGCLLLIGSIIWVILSNILGFILSRIALKKAVIQGG